MTSAPAFRWRGFGIVVAIGMTIWGTACSRSRTTPIPVPPTPAPAVPPAPPTTGVRVQFGARLPETRWRVVTETWLRPMSSNDPEQRIQSSAVVSWRLDRRADGGMRGTGIVQDFRVLASFATTKGVVTDSLIPRVALDIVLDSLTARVVTRPPLVNECDRLEAAAATQARAAAIRTPERVELGMVWRDSTVSLTCRSGVPVVITTTSQTRVVAIDSQTVRLTRETVIQLRGTGSAAMRMLAVAGTGTGRAQIVLRRPDGTLDRLSETTTSRLTLTETAAGRPPREQRMEQDVTTRIELLPRTR